MMRRALLIGLPLTTLTALTVPALAQTPDAKASDVKIELKKQRSVVAPPVSTERGASDADAAARRTEDLRRAEELQRKATTPPPPPLDESVVEGSRGKQLQELPKR